MSFDRRRKQRITLSADCHSAAQTIICDSHRLKQMIWNLLTNAVKFTPTGGEVKIAIEQNHDTIQIIVSDSGQGISPDFLPFVFERFRQADGSSTRIHNGLGLGLAIVRHLAELHGGSVRAASDGISKGSLLLFTYPFVGLTRLKKPSKS